MSEKLNCPGCGQRLEIDDDLIGMEIQCPRCANTFLIESEQEPPQVVPPPPPPSQAVKSRTTKAETKRCHFCGEEILSVAIKCKHCGEFLPGSEPPAEAPKAPAHQASHGKIFQKSSSSFSQHKSPLTVPQKVPLQITKALPPPAAQKMAVAGPAAAVAPRATPPAPAMAPPVAAMKIAAPQPAQPAVAASKQSAPPPAAATVPPPVSTGAPAAPSGKADDPTKSQIGKALSLNVKKKSTMFILKKK